MGRGSAALVAAASAVIVATPVVTWWVVGDQSPPPDPQLTPTYVVRPWSTPPAVSEVVTVGAVILVLAGLAVLAVATRRGRMARAWWWPLTCLVGAGILVGATARAATAPSYDANIGAGVGVIACILVGIPLVLYGVVLAARILARRSVAGPPA